FALIVISSNRSHDENEHEKLSRASELMLFFSLLGRWPLFSEPDFKFPVTMFAWLCLNIGDARTHSRQNLFYHLKNLPGFGSLFQVAEVTNLDRIWSKAARPQVSGIIRNKAVLP